MPINSKPLLDALDKENVRYVIIGGVAAIAHGSATATFDIDVCYAREGSNLERLARALAPIHPRLRGADENLPFKFDARTIRNGLNFTLATDIGDLDLLGEVSGVGSDRDVFANSVETEIFGHKRRILSLEALIGSKQAAARPKDLLVLPELKALLEMRKSDKKK